MMVVYGPHGRRLDIETIRCLAASDSEKAELSCSCVDYLSFSVLKLSLNFEMDSRFVNPAL